MSASGRGISSQSRSEGEVARGTPPPAGDSTPDPAVVDTDAPASKEDDDDGCGSGTAIGAELAGNGDGGGRSVSVPVSSCGWLSGSEGSAGLSETCGAEVLGVDEGEVEGDGDSSGCGSVVAAAVWSSKACCTELCNWLESSGGKIGRAHV